MPNEQFDNATRDDVLARIAVAQSEGWAEGAEDSYYNGAPTIGTLLKLADDYGQIRYMGYQQRPARRYEGVTVEGFVCAGLTADDALRLVLLFRGADELTAKRGDDLTYTVRAWWD